MLSGVAALLVYVLEINKIDANRILDDPPRPDFSVPVRARRRRFDPSGMQSPIEVAAGRFASGVLDLAAYLEAAVRADERGQAAEAAEKFGQQEARLFEGERATERAAETGERVASDAFELAITLASDPDLAAFVPAIRQMVADLPVRDERQMTATFSPEALAYVHRTGLVTSYLFPEIRVAESDVEAAVSDPFEAIAQRTAAFGGSTLVATRVLRTGYGKKQREVLSRGEQTRQPHDERSSPGVPELVAEADQRGIAEGRRIEAARRWLTNFINLYAGIDTGEADPVHHVRQQARGFLEAGPTERDPFVISEQIALALPNDRRAAALAAGWREELRGLMP